MNFSVDQLKAAANKIHEAAPGGTEEEKKNKEAVGDAFKTLIDEASTAVNQEEAYGADRVAHYDSTLKHMIICLEEIQCAFCQGWGHKAKKCSTLATLNRKTADVPGLKQAWGKMKSAYIGSAFDDTAPKAAIKRR